LTIITPRELFQTSGYLAAGNYDVAPYGQHILMIKQDEGLTNPKELKVILNGRKSSISGFRRGRNSCLEALVHLAPLPGGVAERHVLVFEARA